MFALLFQRASNASQADTYALKASQVGILRLGNNPTSAMKSSSSTRISCAAARQWLVTQNRPMVVFAITLKAESHAAWRTPKERGYDDVPESYVIFICLVDPLGANLPRYELRTACANEPSVTVDDGASTILLNAGAWEQEENAEVAGMLQYAQTGKPDGLLASDIARAVDAKNLDRRWVRVSMGVMTYEHEFTVLRNAVAEKQAELDALTAQAEEVTTLMTAATAQAEAAHAEVDALRRLSAELYRAGRIDEYIAALDDPDLMTTLKAEFAL